MRATFQAVEISQRIVNGNVVRDECRLNRKLDFVGKNNEGANRRTGKEPRILSSLSKMANLGKQILRNSRGFWELEIVEIRKFLTMRCS